jgi:hypothetical protein
VESKDKTIKFKNEAGMSFWIAEVLHRVSRENFKHAAKERQCQISIIYRNSENWD